MDVVIYGAGGLARSAHQVLKDMNTNLPLGDPKRMNMLGFLSGYSNTHGTSVHEIPILGGASWLIDRKGIGVIVAIGESAARKKIVEEIRRISPSSHFPIIIHPKSFIGDHVMIGEGTVICAGTVVTTDIEIGRHVFINWNCAITHDDTIGDFVTVSSGATIAGDVQVGEGCFIGTNCSVVPHVTIGSWSIVGAGTVVIENVPNNVTVVGTPARIVQERPVNWQDDVVITV